MGEGTGILGLLPKRGYSISASGLPGKRIRRGASANDVAASERSPEEAVANFLESRHTRSLRNGDIHLSKHSRDRAPGRAFRRAGEEVQSARRLRLLSHLRLPVPQKSDSSTLFSKQFSLLVPTLLQQVEHRTRRGLDCWS